MKTIAFFFLAALICGCKPTAKPQRWEYKIVSQPDDAWFTGQDFATNKNTTIKWDTLEVLKKYQTGKFSEYQFNLPSIGADEWELVSTAIEPGREPKMLLFFKRPARY